MVGRTKCKLRIYPISNVWREIIPCAKHCTVMIASCLNCSFYSVLLCGLFSTFSIYDGSFVLMLCTTAVGGESWPWLHINDFVGDRGVWIFEGGSGVYLVLSTLGSTSISTTTLVLAAGCEMNSEHVLVPGCLIDLTAAFVSKRYDPLPSRTSALLMLCLSWGYVGRWGHKGRTCLT